VTAVEVRPTLVPRRSRGWSALRPGEVWRARLRSPADGGVRRRYPKTSLGVSRVVLQPLITTAMLAPERRFADVI